MELLIKQGGHTVCSGVDNIGGFQHAVNASEIPPTVIIVDYWLSRALTIDFVNSLKRQGFTVVLMGSSFLGRDLATAEQIQFLEKPFTFNELMRAITDA
jgi:DNA-binding NtrC family response regulator